MTDVPALIPGGDRTPGATANKVPGRWNSSLRPVELT
jgi:hypothetical protein